MTPRVATLILAGALGLGPTGGAFAQSAASRCDGMKDQIGCLCALATGGTVSGKTWARGTDKTSFEACVADRGGSTGEKPANIPARR